MSNCRDKDGNLKPESPCAKNARLHAARKAAVMAKAKTAPGSQYADAVAKGQQTSKDK